MKIFPDKKQWNDWSLPSKASYLGLIVAMIGLMIALAQLFIALNPPTQSAETQPALQTDETITSSDQELQIEEAIVSTRVEDVGAIVGWKIFFAFSTECENDLKAKLRSPSGRTLWVMDRGNERCSGQETTYSSENDNDVGTFIGQEAFGTWVFEMTDLDKNGYESTIEQVWMELDISTSSDEKTTRVVFEDLPKRIPEPE